jgi:hypothetical protein
LRPLAEQVFNSRPEIGRERMNSKLQSLFHFSILSAECTRHTN